MFLAFCGSRPHRLYERSCVMKFSTLVLSIVAFSAAALPAMAGGGPVPMPLAGAFGPVGIVGAVVVYGGYRAIKFYRNRH